MKTTGMKKRLTIPSLLGIFILVVAVAAAAYFVQRQQSTNSKADIEPVPQNVKVTNNKSDSFTVTWQTKIKSSGTVRIIKPDGQSTTAVDSLGSSYVHSADVSGLTANSQYQVTIISGEKSYDNNGQPWSTKTVSPTNLSSHISSGTVFTAAGTPAKQALVFLEADNMAPLSSTTSDEGNFVIPLEFAQKADLSGAFDFTDDTLITINVQAGPTGVSRAEIYYRAVTNVPPLVLGQIHDYKNLTGDETADSAVPAADIQAPPAPEASQSPEATAAQDQGILSYTFASEEEIAPGTADVVTLDSLSEGETISSTRPQFFGTAPAQTEIAIELESEKQTDSITSNSQGDWVWSPNKTIAEGPHTITLSWTDANGILQSITRNFVVSAAEKNPGFESTPSASTAPEETLPPQPVSGVGTPVLLLLGGALAFIVGGGFLYKFAND